MPSPPVNVADLFISRFDRVFNAVMGGPESEFWMSGGRGSTKSSFISLCVILLIVAFPFANAVVVRRQSNTLRDSVFPQLQWAVSALGLDGFFVAQVSPMRIVYAPTGQMVVFRGLDDPKKAKGVTFTKGYCAIQWFEEVDQCDSWDDVRSALKSFKRGGGRFWTFYSYNPPVTAWSWANRQRLEMERKPGVLCDHSTYLDVVACGREGWIGEPFVEEAEYLRETNPRAYAWEMLGEVTGTGGAVFENLVRVPLCSEDVSSFGNRRNGVDFGWFPDPWRLVRSEWQPSRRRLIVFEERSANKATPRDTGGIIRESLGACGEQGEPVWCDDAGATEIGVYRRECGINARAAGKGGLRRASYQWLAGLREIAIDPERCPLTYEELALCEFAKDRQGRWVDDYRDGNDHSIDAIRYSIMSEVRRGG